MKKLLVFVLIAMFITLFGVSCSDEDPKSAVNDNNIDLTDNEVEDVIDETNDETVVDEDEAMVDNVTVPDETVDNVVVPDDSQFEKIGDFNLAFEGKINVDLSQYLQIKGGTGDVNFNYKGAPFTFGKLSVVFVQLFPLAILQQGNVAVMWLESAPGLGAETKKVFGFTFPSTIQAGNTTMEAAKAFAFYGDININIQGGEFTIKCVRAAAYAGNLNMESYDGANAKFNASGDLLDPADAGSALPYDTCTD